MDFRHLLYCLDENKILGFGEFGVVFKGCVKVANQEVAVKTIKPGAGKIYLKSLMLELKILMLVRDHENIISIVGAQTSMLNSGKIGFFYHFAAL